MRLMFIWSNKKWWSCYYGYHFSFNIYS